MKFTLKKLKFSGSKASFYTLVPEKGEAKFGEFLGENLAKFAAELSRMVTRLGLMGTKYGAIDDFFKLNESSNNDEKVVAYYDEPDKHLRVYCVRISESLVVLGGGGQKKKSIIRWQQDKKLKKEAEFIMDVSQIIQLKLDTGVTQISQDGLLFTGDLEIEIA